MRTRRNVMLHVQCLSCYNIKEGHIFTIQFAVKCLICIIFTRTSLWNVAGPRVPCRIFSFFSKTMRELRVHHV